MDGYRRVEEERHEHVGDDAPVREPGMVAPEDYVEGEPPGWAGYVIARRIAYFILDILEILLAFRFVFKLLAANPASPFTAFVYALTDPLVAPFRGIFQEVAARGSVVEWATLLAMAVFAVLFWAVMRLVWIIVFSRRETEVHTHGGVYR